MSQREMKKKLAASEDVLVPEWVLLAHTLDGRPIFYNKKAVTVEWAPSALTMKSPA